LNWKIILRTLGLLLLIEGGFIFLSLPFSFYYSGDDSFALIVSGSITCIIGLALFFLFKKRHASEIGKKEGYFIVSAAWLIMALFGAFPYMIHGCIPSFTDAYFESISGFSTTGASILTDVEVIPHGLLFWRALTHWIGGMGIIVFTIAILPIFGFGGMQLFVAESPGPTKDKLHPRIKETARLLWGMYLLLTFLETGLLMLGGMSLWEALCHSFATVATGGFGTKNSSIIGFSPYIQYIITIFMFLAATNFSLYYFAFRGRPGKLIKNQEYWLYLMILIIPSLIITGFLMAKMNMDIEKAFRLAIFQVTSIVSCTGFATADYMLWDPFCWFLLFILMFSGGMAGSTTGSIKVVRHLLLLKTLRYSIRKVIHPNLITHVRLDNFPIPSGVIFGALNFILLYLITFLTGSVLLLLLQVPVIESFGSVATCMGGIGPGLGATGPVGNFAHLPAAAKWTLDAMMYLGRLELFSVLILFAPSFWKK